MTAITLPKAAWRDDIGDCTVANSRNSVQLRWLSSLVSGCLAGAIFGFVFFIMAWMQTSFMNTSSTTIGATDVSGGMSAAISSILDFSLVGALIGTVAISPIVLVLDSAIEHFNSERPIVKWLPLPIILWVGGIGGAATALLIASVWLRSSSILSAVAAHLMISGAIAGIIASLSYAKHSPFVHSRWSTAISKTQEKTQSNGAPTP